MQYLHQFFIEISTQTNQVTCGQFVAVKPQTIGKQCFIQTDQSPTWLLKDAIDIIFKNLGETPLFFIHGFAAANHGLTQRTVLAFENLFLQDSENTTSTILHIVWESIKLNYSFSQKVIEKSKKKLADLIITASQKRSNSQLDLLCHSMGNQFFLETIKAGYLPERVVGQLIFAAADMSMKDFIENEKKVESVAGKILILHHYQDLILIASSVRNRGKRLGQELPRTTQSNRITYLDCSNMKINHSLIAKLNKHTYFLSSDEVRRNIHHFLLS